MEEIPDQLPDSELSESEVSALLHVVLKPAGKTKNRGQPGENGPLVVDFSLIFVWQGPMMLTSLSWCAFLLGYGTYTATPLLKWQGWNASCTVSYLNAKACLDVRLP